MISLNYAYVNDGGGGLLTRAEFFGGSCSSNT
jgi:hypothetical protein